MNVFDRLAAVLGLKGRTARLSGETLPEGSPSSGTLPAVRYDAGAPDGGQLTVGAAQLKQLAALSRMRRGVADVSVSRQRLDLQAADLKRALDSLEAQAAASAAAGDSGAAQTARGRHHIMTERYGDLLGQRDALAEQESMLTTQLSQLQARVSGFNVTAETQKAAQAAAEARHRIAQSLNDFQEPDT